MPTDHEVWVSEDRCTFARITREPDDRFEPERDRAILSVSIATRSHPDAVWGPPIKLEREANG